MCDSWSGLSVGAIQAARAASPAFAFQTRTLSPDDPGCLASGRPIRLRADPIPAGTSRAAITIDTTDTTIAMRRIVRVELERVWCRETSRSSPAIAPCCRTFRLMRDPPSVAPRVDPVAPRLKSPVCAGARRPRSSMLRTTAQDFEQWLCCDLRGRPLDRGGSATSRWQVFRRTRGGALYRGDRSATGDRNGSWRLRSRTPGGARPELVMLQEVRKEPKPREDAGPRRRANT